MSAKNLYDDFNKINNWAFQWKMNFNPDLNKQAQKVIFSRKIQKSAQPPLVLNNNIMNQSVTQKQLGMFLDAKMGLQEHLKSIFSKINKTIGLLRKLYHISPYRLYLQFVSLLLDLISTTSYMIKYITLHFTENLHLFNSTHNWL